MSRRLLVLILVVTLAFSGILMAKTTLVMWDQLAATEDIVKMFNEK